VLDKKIANDVIQAGLECGANFCDVFVEKTTTQTISFRSQSVKDIKSGIDFGIGVRLIFGQNALYAYTNSDKLDDLIHMTRNLAGYYQRDQMVNPGALDFSKEVAYKNVRAVGDNEVGLEHKISVLKKLDTLTRAQSEKISQVNLGIWQFKQNIEIFDSEGLYAKEERPYVRLTATAIAKDGSNQATGSHHPGARGGWDYVETVDLNSLSQEISKQSLTVLDAEPCPAGKMPVVIDNGFGGVIFHEACGHLLETTSVEKKASVMWDKKGEMVAHEALSAVDDGTIDGEWGSLSIDDEGMQTERTQLIKNGRLENFMCDRLGHMKTGHPRTGSGRRQSYKYAPASRMRNTFIEPGQYSLEELFSSMGDGLYAKKMGGGSVNPGTGEFNFSVQEGYLVKNGKVEKAIKGATLIGQGADVLKKISMVGSNFQMSTGMCGSVSGSIPANVGQPAIKVDEILVGGQA
jgi:TldD protein